MSCRHIHFLPILVTAVLACCSLNAQAIPKVAEHEDAPVTTGADVLRPKPSTKAVVPKKAGHVVKTKSTKKIGYSPKANHRKK